MYETDAQFDANDRVGQMAEPVLRRQFSSGFGSLSEQDRCFFCVYKVELEVKNGGLFQLMVNSSPEVLRATPGALRLVGASRSAEVVERSFSLAFAGGLAKSQADHEAALDSVSEHSLSLIEQLNRQLDETEEHLCTLLLEHLGVYAKHS